jgi:hypothetical protein
MVPNKKSHRQGGLGYFWFTDIGLQIAYQLHAAYCCGQEVTDKP